MIAIFLSLLMTASLAKERCANSLVRIETEAEPRVESTRICLDDETRPGGRPDLAHVVSASCMKGTCLAMEGSRKAQTDPRATFEQRFELCKSLGGKPEVIEFQWNGRFQPSDRCSFDKDRSYMDTMSFVGLGRFAPKSIKPQPSTNRKASAGNNDGRDRKR